MLYDDYFMCKKQDTPIKILVFLMLTINTIIIIIILILNQIHTIIRCFIFKYVHERRQFVVNVVIQFVVSVITIKND